ncbi:MAG: glycosyltransferase family 2 protein [Acidobacteriota bacterium]
MRISACVITLNEEDRIVHAIESARGVCDEIVVVDGGSTDRTVELARGAGATVYERPFDDFTPQKNFANARAQHPWILSLDADERVSQELADELRRLTAAEPDQNIAAFSFPRHTYYLGRLIRHNWYPEIKPRLFRRDCARWAGDFVHEGLKVEGRVERLRGPVLHYTYRDISDQVRRMDFYSGRAAHKMFAAGKRTALFGYTILPVWTFLRFYLIGGGFLDRWPGFVIAAMSAYYVMLKHLKLREMLAERSVRP